MKAPPASSVQPVFIQPRAELCTAQHGKSVQVASHFLIIIPHLGSWIQIHGCICDERLEEGAGNESFMRCRAGVGSHNENAKIELFSRSEGRVMRVKQPGGI